MVNAFLIGAGAGLVIPFMNLYFKTRFDCSSAQIGVFFSVAQVATAIAMLLGPVIARRFGKLRTATASQLLSLPFLVTLGAEQRLEVAVGAFWLRAMLMQASTPLIGAFVMETVPPAAARALRELHQPGVERGLGRERHAQRALDRALRLRRAVLRHGHALQRCVAVALSLVSPRGGSLTRDPAVRGGQGPARRRSDDGVTSPIPARGLRGTVSRR